MIVSVDISEVEEITERANSAFDGMPDVVFGFVEGGAATLVASDPYQNHTGDLRAATEAVVIEDNVDAWEFDLQMGEEYASYVNDKGFSFIDDVGEQEVPSAIEKFLFDDMPDQIIG